MNKIGFRIYRFKEGPFIGQTENDGPWTSQVVDIRDILKLYEQAFDKFAIFMSFSQTGTYITIARLISGRTGDNIAGWLYIPNNIDVPEDTLFNIIEHVKYQLSLPQIDDNHIRQIFSHQYPVQEFAEYVPSNTEKVYAQRMGNFYPFKTLIGANRYQSYYSRYHAILLSDNNTLKVIDPSVANITTEKLAESLVFCPPTPGTLPADVKVFLDKKPPVPFDKPIRVSKGDTVNVLFRRTSARGASYRDMVMPVQVLTNNQRCEYSPNVPWNIIIKRDMFKILSSDTGENITSQTKVTIGGKPINDKGAMLPSDQAGAVPVSFNAPGYAPMELTCDFLNQRSCVVRLNRKEVKRTWNIELRNGYMAEMTLTGRRVPDSSESPINGYVNEGSHLVYTKDNVWMNRAIGFGAAAILVLLLTILGFFCDFGIHWGGSGEKEKVEETSSGTSKGNNNSEPMEDVSEDKTGTGTEANMLAEAIIYLDSVKPTDNKGKWSREEMEKFPAIRGLFDDMNEFHLEKLTGQWATTLAESESFRAVVEAAKKTLKNQWNPLQGNHKERYNMDAEDTEIYLLNYVNWLSQDQTPKGSGGTTTTGKNTGTTTGGSNPVTTVETGTGTGGRHNVIEH